MFDATPAERDDEPDPNLRAVVMLTITYAGELEFEVHHDPGDEALIADQLRAIADDLAASLTRKEMH